MKALLPWIALATCAVSEAEDGLKRADLGKLADPAARDAEVGRLAGCDGDKQTLVSYRLLRAPQRNGGEPLQVIAANYRRKFEWRSSIVRDQYEVDNPEQLFSGNPDAKPGSLSPDLSRIKDSVLIVVGPDGKELPAFQRDNHLADGYLFDFDHDGILDRADAVESLVQGSQLARVLSVRSVEAEPRTLLRVLLGLGPVFAPAYDNWTFSCLDEGGDGLVEIAFERRQAVSDEEAKRIVFRWDKDKQSYAPGIPTAESPLRILNADDRLEQIVKEEGLRFKAAANPLPAAADAPYLFRTLKEASDAEILSFFINDDWKLAPAGPQHGLAKEFWSTSPKQAAIALADANRSPLHRRNWKLVVDDRNGIASPASGWYVYQYGSSGCYSYTSQVYALRFGMEQSWLLATDYRTSGEVGANPLADQTGHSARVIPLGKDEARFLADTLFWLDRIRSVETGSGMPRHGYSSSSADGNGRLHLLADGSPVREVVSDTVWAGPITNRWGEDYTPEVCLNLVTRFLLEHLPDHLGERWRVAPELATRGLSTPLEERLQPRLDDAARNQLARNLRSAFDRHAVDPLPPPALARLVACIGEEAMVDFRPDLALFQTSLPQADDEDREFAALEKRFDFDHFGQPLRDDPHKHPKDYARYQMLIEKRRFAPGPALRHALALALRKLDLATDPKRLAKEAEAGAESSSWALGQLRRKFPKEWEDSLVARFQEGDAEERQSLFWTLSTASPEAGKRLVRLMTAKEVAEQLIEVAEFETEADPERAVKRVPALLAKVRSRNAEYTDRGSAIRLLSSIPLSEPQLAEFRSLLLKELENPQQGSMGHGTLEHAVEALSKLPDAAAHLDAIQMANRGDSFGFTSGHEAIERLTAGRPDRQQRLAAYFTPCFEKHHGGVYELYFAALAYDLKDFAPLVAAHATAGPEGPYGIGEYDWPDGFAGPAGQRYHTAREVSALWSETDSETLGRMWISFVASHAYQLGHDSPGDRLAEILLEKAAGAMRKLPEEIRERCLAANLASFPAGPRRDEVAKLFELLAKKAG